MHVSRFSGLTEPLLRIQQQVATAKRINRPSDDPSAQGQVLRYDKRLFETDQYLSNIKNADFYMSSTESTLRAIQDQLTKARALATQGANTTSLQGWATAAVEANDVYAHLLALSNTDTGGRFLFSGPQSETRPFAMRGTVMRAFVGSDLGFVGTPVDPATTPITVNASNNQLTLTTRNGTFSSVTISAGVYTTGAALAAAVQSALDNNPEFRGAGRLITAHYEGGRLVLRSGLATPPSLTSGERIPPVSGSGASIIATAGSAAGTLGLSSGTNEPNVTIAVIKDPVTGVVVENNLLDVMVDGIGLTVAVELGTYASGSALAGAVQTAINTEITSRIAAGTLPIGTVATVTVAYDADHRLVMTSDATGDTSEARIAGGLAGARLGLAGGSNQPVIEYLGNPNPALDPGGDIPTIIGPSTTGIPATAMTVVANIPGDRLFKGGDQSPGVITNGIDILAVVGGLQASLATGNEAGLQKAVYDLNTAQKQISSEQTLLGARRNTVSFNQGILEDFKTTVSGFRSQAQDTDYATAMAELTSYMGALEAATQVENIILKDMSLLEFLK